MFHRTRRGGSPSRPLQAVAIPATFPTTHCGTGGDKPRPYGKSESVSVGAGFMPARRAVAIPISLLQSVLRYGRIYNPPLRGKLRAWV